MSRRRAFSLVELIVVMSIVAVAAAVVVPTAVGSTAPQRVRTASRIVFAHAQNARSDAVALGRRVDLVFDLDERGPTDERVHAVRTYHEADPFGAPGELSPSPAPFGPPTPLGDDILVLGVAHGAHIGRGLDLDTQRTTEGVVALTFLPDGTCHAAEIWIGSTSSARDQLVVKVDGVTGRVRILDGDALEAERAAGQ